jgi:DNA-directed RNA polymerase specialized sigma24 family protein
MPDREISCEERAYYKNLGIKGGELAIRFLKSNDTSDLEEVLDVVGKLSIDFIRFKVWNSRNSHSGLLDNAAAEIILLKVKSKVQKALQKSVMDHSFENTNFKGWVLTIASRTFLDEIQWKQKRKEKEAAPLKFMPLSEDFPEAETAVLYEKEILNLILGGLLEVKNHDGANVWTARVLLGHKERSVCDLFDMPRNTCASHFRRASMEIFAHVLSRPAYKDVSFRGLKKLFKHKLGLEESDLAHIKDENQRDALEIAFGKTISAQDLASEMDCSAAEAMDHLRKGIAALSRAKITRAKAAVAAGASEEVLDDWLWDSVTRVLEAFPEEPVKTRSQAPPSEDVEELAALCELGVFLAHDGSDHGIGRTLGELLCDLIPVEKTAAEAAALGIDADSLEALLADALSDGQITPALLARIGGRFNLSAPILQAALRVSRESKRKGKTRAASAGRRKWP